MIVQLVIALIIGYFVPRILRYVQMMKRRYDLVSLVPGPKALPIVGNALNFGKTNCDLADFLISSAKAERAKGNQVMRIWVGGHPLIAPLTGEAIKPLLDSNDEITKGDDYDFYVPWLGLGLLISTGAKWKSRRRMLTPTFHFAMLDGYVEKMNKHAKILGEILNDTVGREIEIYQYIKHCALDIICDTAMGKELDSQHDNNHPYVLAVADYNKVAMNYTMNPITWFPLYWYVVYHRRYTNLLNTLTGFTKQVIADRIRATEAGELNFEDGEKRERKAFLDMMIEMRENNHLTLEDIREEVDTFMFEGHDTTASAMAWTVWCLATNPHLQQRAYEEVHSVFGESDRECTVEDIKNMPYLERCIKEALRIFPAVPMVNRKLQKDFEMQGYTIPKGVDVMIWPLVLHHNETAYPNDWVYDPDNFLPDKIAERNAFDFIPFSAGPRNCIGQKFAIYEEKLVLSTILRRFSIHTDRKMLDNRFAPEAILRPSLGIPVTLKRRH